MNVSSNIKDTLSTWVGILAAIAGGILLAAQNGLVIPVWLTTICGSIVAISAAIIGYLTGKTPAGIKKAPEQIVEQNLPAVKTETNGTTN